MVVSTTTLNFRLIINKLHLIKVIEFVTTLEKFLVLIFENFIILKCICKTIFFKLQRVLNILKKLNYKVKIIYLVKFKLENNLIFIITVKEIFLLKNKNLI